MSEDAKREATKNESLKLFLIVAALMVAIWAAYPSWLAWLIPDGDDIEKARAARGQFGDMFGGINALFSALAFAVLIYTMYLQRKELRLQREELAETREEMKLARGEAKRQADTSTRTALIGALTALWEHHDSSQESAGGNNDAARIHGDIKGELSLMMENLLREVAITNSVLLRDEGELRDQIKRAVSDIRTLLSGYEQFPTDQQPVTVYGLYEVQNCLAGLKAKLRLNVDPKSSAGNASATLENLLREGPGEPPPVQASPQQREVAIKAAYNANLITWIRQVLAQLNWIESASFRSDGEAADGQGVRTAPRSPTP